MQAHPSTLKRHVAQTLAAAVALAAFITAPCRAQDVEPVAPALQLVKIPMASAGLFGSTLDLSTEVFKPVGAGPFPVVVYAHGRAGTQQERSALTEVVPRQFMRFWLSKGFAVVAPARPNNKKTGGSDQETPGHRWDGRGNCTGVPNAEKVAATASAALVTALDWTRNQPWANGSKIILAGNSVGGLTTMALSAANLPGVVAYINFAGGVAGNPDQAPGKSCAPEKVREAFTTYGQTAKTPSLWLYAQNDQYWGAEMPRVWHAAYVAGGSEAEFVDAPAVANADGHNLIFVGKAIWMPHVERFLKRIGFDQAP